MKMVLREACWCGSGWGSRTASRSRGIAVKLTPSAPIPAAVAKHTDCLISATATGSGVDAECFCLAQRGALAGGKQSHPGLGQHIHGGQPLGVRYCRRPVRAAVRQRGEYAACHHGQEAAGAMPALWCSRAACPGAAWAMRSRSACGCQSAIQAFNFVQDDEMHRSLLRDALAACAVRHQLVARNEHNPPGTVALCHHMAARIMIRGLPLVTWTHRLKGITAPKDR